MTEHIPVEGKIGLYRDSDSTAIINRDKKAYLDYMKRKMREGMSFTEAHNMAMRRKGK